MIQDRPDGMLTIRNAAAALLLRYAVTLIARMKAQYVQGPPRSKVNEYLKAETFHARDNLAYSPTDPEDVARQGSVRVGYRRTAWYAAWWEARGLRKGLLDKLRELQNSGAIDSNVQGSFQSS